jgi:hypothetical protein
MMNGLKPGAGALKTISAKASDPNGMYVHQTGTKGPNPRRHRQVAPRRRGSPLPLPDCQTTPLQGSFFWLENTEGKPLVGVFATNHQPHVLPPYFAARKKNPAPLPLIKYLTRLPPSSRPT